MLYSWHILSSINSWDGLANFGNQWQPAPTRTGMGGLWEHEVTFSLTSAISNLFFPSMPSHNRTTQSNITPDFTLSFRQLIKRTTFSRKQNASALSNKHEYPWYECFINLRIEQQKRYFLLLLPLKATWGCCWQACWYTMQTLSSIMQGYIQHTYPVQGLQICPQCSANQSQVFPRLSYVFSVPFWEEPVNCSAH